MCVVAGTDLMSRRFVEKGAAYCPVCGAKTERHCAYGEAIVENTIVFQQAHCLKCGSTWTEKFELYEIDEIDLGPGYVWDDEKEVDPNDRGERPEDPDGTGRPDRAA